MGRRVVPVLAFAMVGVVTLLAVNPAEANPTDPIYEQKSAPYVVTGAGTLADRNRIGGTGAAIDAIEDGASTSRPRRRRHSASRVSVTGSRARRPRASRPPTRGTTTTAYRVVGKRQQYC
jgi:hypothetical protein